MYLPHSRILDTSALQLSSVNQCDSIPVLPDLNLRPAFPVRKYRLKLVKDVFLPYLSKLVPIDAFRIGEKLWVDYSVSTNSNLSAPTAAESIITVQTIPAANIAHIWGVLATSPNMLHCSKSIFHQASIMWALLEMAKGFWKQEDAKQIAMLGV